MNGLPASSPAIRIHQGETVVGQAWSNTATSLWGYFRIVYDDGSEDALTLDRLLLLNNRTTGVLVCRQVAKHDGYVVSGQICQVSGIANQATQRGQCFVRAFVVNEPFSAEALSAAGCRAMLCMGYIFSGVDVALGQMVEPGPAGGQGHIRTISLGNPAVNVDFTSQAVPIGAIWRHRSFQATLAQGITQTPLPTITYDDGSNKIAGTGAGDAQPASTTVQYYASVNMPYNETGGGPLTGLLSVFPLPDLLLQGGYDINWVTVGLGANSDWGAGFIEVEEWVVPS